MSEKPTASVAKAQRLLDAAMTLAEAPADERWQLHCEKEYGINVCIVTDADGEEMLSKDRIGNITHALVGVVVGTAFGVYHGVRQARAVLNGKDAS